MMNEKNTPYKDKQWLHDQYIDQKRSTPEMGEECHTNVSTILYWLRKFGIPIRSRSEASRVRKKRDGYQHSKETIEKMIRTRERNTNWKKKKIAPYISNDHRRDKFKKLFLEFLEDRCMITRGVSVKKERLINELNDYLKDINIPTISPKSLLLTSLFKEMKDTIQYSHNTNRNRYYGITLKSKYIGKAIQASEKEENLTSGEACRLLSCDPGVKKLKEIVLKFNAQYPDVVIFEDKIEKAYRIMERFLWERNVYRGLNVKIGAILYITSRICGTGFSMMEMSRIARCTENSLRYLYHFVPDDVKKEMEMVLLK